MRFLPTTYCLLVFCIFTPGASAGTRYFRCKAVDPQNGSVIFTCSGSEVLNGKTPVSAQIRYRLPNGKYFARETINYRKDRFSPDLVFTDDRDGRREMIEKTVAGYNLLYQDSAKGTPESHRLKHGDSETTALTVPGLPQFIEQQWPRYVAGEQVVFYCVFPLQRKLLRLRSQVERNLTYKKLPAVLVRMQPQNFVYRWFSDPVFLTFHAKTRRLLRYQGLHYIRDPRSGGGSIVDLTFEW